LVACKPLALKASDLRLGNHTRSSERFKMAQTTIACLAQAWRRSRVEGPTSVVEEKVMARNTARRLNASNKALTRLPYLARPLLRFSLSDEVQQLRNTDSWQRGTGRSSKTLAKYPDFHIVLVLMKANTQMSQHHVDARISIHSLQGRIRIHLPDQNVDLATGELMALEYGIPHDVEALEESAFLITISWPGGTKEERHAMVNQT
jgi:quercetin dioxygenase-like cupin family protein